VDSDLSKPLEHILLIPEMPAAGGAEGEVGVRADRFIAMRLPWRSRTSIQEWFRDKRVTQNGRVIRSSSKVGEHDKIEIDVSGLTLDADEQVAVELPVLYEDAFVLAVNKPAGLVMHPVGRKRFNTLISLLHAKYRKLDGDGKPLPGDVNPKLVHRLDGDTSGVVVIAMHESVYGNLTAQFENRVVAKQYLAITEPPPVFAATDDAGLGVIDAPIGQAINGRTRMQMAVRPDLSGESNHALTRFHIERSWPSPTAPGTQRALVRCFPETGRTHQIRVHLAHAGAPILADRLYGPLADWSFHEEDDEQGARAGKETAASRPLHNPAMPDTPAPDYGIARQALHAAHLSLRHPVTGEPLELDAPLPDDMQALLP
jgi:23S rRNA pseudouridine1911/1915/1917 synthase